MYDTHVTYLHVIYFVTFLFCSQKYVRYNAQFSVQNVNYTYTLYTLYKYTLLWLKYRTTLELLVQLSLVFIFGFAIYHRWTQLNPLTCHDSSLCQTKHFFTIDLHTVLINNHASAKTVYNLQYILYLTLYLQYMLHFTCFTNPST